MRKQQLKQKAALDAKSAREVSKSTGTFKRTFENCNSLLENGSRLLHKVQVCFWEIALSCPGFYIFELICEQHLFLSRPGKKPWTQSVFLGQTHFMSPYASIRRTKSALIYFIVHHAYMILYAYYLHVSHYYIIIPPNLHELPQGNSLFICPKRCKELCRLATQRGSGFQDTIGKANTSEVWGKSEFDKIREFFKGMNAFQVFLTSAFRWQGRWWTFICPTSSKNASDEVFEN